MWGWVSGVSSAECELKRDGETELLAIMSRDDRDKAGTTQSRVRRANGVGRGA